MMTNNTNKLNEDKITTLIKSGVSSIVANDVETSLFSLKLTSGNDAEIDSFIGIIDNTTQNVLSKLRIRIDTSLTGNIFKDVIYFNGNENSGQIFFTRPLRLDSGHTYYFSFEHENTLQNHKLNITILGNRKIL